MPWMWTLFLLSWAQVEGSGQGPFDVRDAQLRGISGITHARADTYYVIDDIDRRVGPPRFHEMRIEIDPRTGHIGAASRERSVPFARGGGFEGIAYLRRTGEIAVCSERSHTVDVFDTEGVFRRRLDLPGVYSKAVVGRSLESLAYDEGQDALWTANEAPLSVDAGTSYVRIQRFVAEVPAGQYAVALEPARDDAKASFNGLCELLALPDGTLLALERDFHARAMNLSIRLYRLDWHEATDVSELTTLQDARIQPVRKIPVLRPSTFPTGAMVTLANYESMVLGPSLADGSRCLLLGPADDNDNGFFLPETLHTLRVRLADEE